MSRLNLSVVGLALVVALSGLTSVGVAAEPLIVFLVRHAEKVDASRDPELSESGKKRAAHLASVLQDAKLQQIHSSDFIRTRETATPIAARLKLPVRKYDPRDLATLAERLRKAGGRHLVVGHSNTTPGLVKLLGGESGDEIDEPKEYDRLYVLVIDPQGKATTMLLRYGKPYSPASR